MKALASIALILYLGCGPESERITSSDHPTIREFVEARSLVPTWSKDVFPAAKQWNEVLKLGRNLTLRVTALDTVGARFIGQYSDEQEPRLIGNPGDYVHPVDIRVNSALTKVFCKASGLAGGVQQVTIVFEFDIHSRNLIHSYHVDPKFLPANPMPLSPAP
jgi:hypothetical protein